MILFFINFIFYFFSSLLAILINYDLIFNGKMQKMLPIKWGELCLSFTNSKVINVEGSNELAKENCVFLLNHRDLYDFPIDCYITNGKGLFISRLINLYIFPIQLLFTYICKNCFYFNRSGNIDKNKFNSDIYNKLIDSPCKNINIYPEGTRIHKMTRISIKKGGMHLAWKYKMNIQIIITSNKEHILNLKKFTAKHNVNLYCYKSQIIKPENFDNFDDFFKYIDLEWSKSWNKIFMNSKYLIN